jgi:hypothetical protein
LGLVDLGRAYLFSRFEVPGPFALNHAHLTKAAYLLFALIHVRPPGCVRPDNYIYAGY